MSLYLSFIENCCVLKTIRLSSELNTFNYFSVFKIIREVCAGTFIFVDCGLVVDIREQLFILFNQILSSRFAHSLIILNHGWVTF